MTIAAADLKIPKGELQPVWFPDGDLDTSIAAWLAEVDLGAISAGDDQDRATRAYCYARAYQTVAGRLASMPTTEKTNDLTTTYDAGRISYFSQQATRWEAEYQAILAEAPTVQDKPTSNAAQAVPVW